MENDFSKSKFSSKKSIFSFLGLILFLCIFYFFLLTAPMNFPVGNIVSIEPGDSLRAISLNLKKDHIIRSRLAFEFFSIIYGGDRRIIAADYLFENRTPVWQVARRIATGERHLAPVKITIPEGFTKEDIANTFASKLRNFNKGKFLTSAREGYLFPDTYFFFSTGDEVEVLKSLTDNFNKKIATVEKDINAIGKSTEDIIKMASVIEGEANGSEDRDIISGILWRRITLGMPLQADVAPETYQNKGLPKVPVSNPGLSSIRSAIYPESSPYLYYLHDKEGNAHYAKTFAEHRANVVKYLK